MDVPRLKYGKAQFCLSHGYATQFRLKHLALHMLPDTFNERMKWSWWGAYLPAVLMVFPKLIIIPLSDAMCRQSLWPHRETTQELFCARWSHSSHSMMYLSRHHPLLFPKFSIFRQGQAQCKFGYQLTFRPNRRSFWGSLLLMLTFTIAVDQCPYNYVPSLSHYKRVHELIMIGYDAA